MVRDWAERERCLNPRKPFPKRDQRPQMGKLRPGGDRNPLKVT